MVHRDTKRWPAYSPDDSFVPPSAVARSLESRLSTDVLLPPWRSRASCIVRWSHCNHHKHVRHHRYDEATYSSAIPACLHVEGL